MFERIYKNPRYLSERFSNPFLQESSLKKAQLKQNGLLWRTDHWNEINFINLDSVAPGRWNAGNKEGTHFLI